MGQESAATEDYGNDLSSGAPELKDEPIVDPMLDDDDGESEGKPEAAEETDTKSKKDSRIPLARHKEMMDKHRSENDQLRAELARVQGVKAAEKTTEALDATETKLVAMEGDYNKLLADGEIDKASAKMTEIRRLERTVGEQKASAQAEVSEARAVERVRYDTVVERIETAFPEMDPQSAEFDAEKVAEVLDLKSSFEKSGMTPSAALQKAVKYALGAETSKQENATNVTPNASKEDVAKLRKQDALKRNIDAAKRTPASTAKTGLNNEDGGELTAEKAMKMSQDEFAKLDEKTLARMRGDTI